MKTMQSTIKVYRPGAVYTVGDGFEVRNLFPSNALGEDMSPFLLMDYAGPTEYQPTHRPRGVGEHPHKGFETVTLVYQGDIQHRDSTGMKGLIGPGDVQWMTAAAGVVHEERHGPMLTESGGTLEMVQLWVNLPRREKLSPPRYQAIRDQEIPVHTTADGLGRVRVVAGAFNDLTGPAQTVTPIEIFDLYFDGNGEVSMPIPAGHNVAVLVRRGAVTLQGSTVVGEGSLARYTSDGAPLALVAQEDSAVLVIAGEPLGEPVVAQGPFVMNTVEEIHEAMREYQAGRMGRLDD